MLYVNLLLDKTKILRYNHIKENTTHFRQALQNVFTW
jgi:hypothetical protein